MNAPQSTDERCKRCGHKKSAHELPGINVCSQFMPSDDPPLPADQKLGECHRNPRQTGHCEHTSTRKMPDGMYIAVSCCWCGKTISSSKVNMPEHGPHAPR